MPFSKILRIQVKGVYENLKEFNLDYLRKFQCFIRRNFDKFEHYGKIKPVSYQSVKLYGTAKTRKFNNINYITSVRIKTKPIIDQNYFYTYNKAQIISDYFQPLSKTQLALLQRSIVLWRKYIYSLIVCSM